MVWISGGCGFFVLIREDMKRVAGVDIGGDKCWEKRIPRGEKFVAAVDIRRDEKNVTEARRENQGCPSRAQRAGDRRERAPLVFEVGLSVAGKGGFTVQWSLFLGVLAVLR